MNRAALHRVLTAAPQSSPRIRAFQFSLIGLIVLNIVAVVLQSVPEIYESAKWWFDAFELFSVAVFTVEYVLRVYACTADERFSSPVLGRIKFALHPLALIDLLAILPSYFVFLGLDLRALRMLRLMRLTRIFKLSRYSRAIQTLGRVLVSARFELLSSLTVMFLLLLVASSLMHYAEHEAQPEAFGSIPKAMWWAIITLTTVGYGDVYPVTLLGKFIAGGVAILGIASFAIPTSILGSAYLNELQGAHKRACPHCGKEP